MSRDEIERELVTELRVLESFRREHVTRYPGARVDRDDPDVQRLIEAVALSSVRTRVSMQSNLQRMWRRLCGSYFDFLMSPLPSCAIVQAAVTPRLVETQVISRGSHVVLTNQQGESATFTTLDELRILPIQLDSVEILARDGKRRIELRFSTRFARTDAVGLLRLHTSCAGHYGSALNMLYQLRAHLLRASVVYEPSLDKEQAVPCAVSFGALPEGPAHKDALNPQDAVRRFFHFPERELYLNVEVPQSPRPWQAFVLRLEMDSAYPASPRPDRDTFQLFTVPVDNRVSLPAAQIVLDGTRTAHPILHADQAQQCSLLRVRGVYRVEEAGMVPMRASSVADGESPDCYEVEDRIEEGGHPHLLVRDPSALLEPVKLHLDCEWHQPWFAAQTYGAVAVSVPYRILDGVSISVRGGVTAPCPGVLGRSTQGLLQFLSLRMKPVLNLDELLRVLDVFGSVETGPYRRLPRMLRQIRVEPALDSALRGSGLRHLYHIKIDPFAQEDEALVWHFLRELARLLDSWNSEASVELIVNTGDTGDTGNTGDAGDSGFALPLSGAAT